MASLGKQADRACWGAEPPRVTPSMVTAHDNKDPANSRMLSTANCGRSASRSGAGLVSEDQTTAAASSTPANTAMPIKIARQPPAPPMRSRAGAPTETPAPSPAAIRSTRRAPAASTKRRQRNVAGEGAGGEQQPAEDERGNWLALPTSPPFNAVAARGVRYEWRARRHRARSRASSPKASGAGRRCASGLPPWSRAAWR
jgi:hypothetical protein